MRILFLSAWYPDPPSNGSRLRVRHLLRALALRHDVSLISFADQPDVDPDAPAVHALCRSVQVLPMPRFDPTSWRARLAWLAPQPRSLVATHSPAMADAVRRAAAAADVVVASQLACAAYVRDFGGLPALFEELELGSLRGRLKHAAAAERWQAVLMWAKYRHYLRRLVPRFRACTVVSEVERRLAADLLDGADNLQVLPNGVAAAEYDLPGAAPRPDTLIFTGSFRYGPNYDAMRWFVGEVWPRVLRVRPAARLLITGAHDDRPLPPAANLTRSGFVDDLRPLLATSWLAIGPIHGGGGTRIKILEAMAAGTPVVCTSKAAEGLSTVDGEHLLIADTPDAFADRVVALLADAQLRARLAAAARALVEAEYDWRVLGPRFVALVESLAGSGIRTA